MSNFLHSGRITPCSQPFLGVIWRAIVFVAAIVMSADFLLSTVRNGDFRLEDILFIGVLPGLAIGIASLKVVIDREQIFQEVFWTWRFSAVRWDDVQKIEVYRTSRRAFINMTVTAKNNRRFHFSVPDGSSGAETFQNLANAFHRNGQNSV